MYKHYTPPLLQNLIIFQAFKKNCCLYFLPVKSVNKSKNTIRFFFAECENQNCRVVSMLLTHSPLPKYGIPSKFFSSSLTFCYKLVVDSKPNWRWGGYPTIQIFFKKSFLVRILKERSILLLLLLQHSVLPKQGFMLGSWLQSFLLPSFGQYHLWNTFPNRLCELKLFRWKLEPLILHTFWLKLEYNCACLYV